MALWLALHGLLLLIGYLLGAVPSGYLAGRMLKGIDIREHGSGSTGATNVLRTLGAVPAIVVLLADILKGVAAIALVSGFYANQLGLPYNPPPTIALNLWQPWAITLAGLVALLGHSKSVFLNFTGGKSVATSLGILLALNWVVGLGTFSVFLVMLAITRIVSISSITGAIAVSVFMVVTQQPLPYVLFGIAGGLYVIVRHRSNIQRLLEGTEPRLGQKAPEASPSTES